MGLKSRKKLFEVAKDKLLGCVLPETYKYLENEVYGRDARIYLQFLNEEYCEKGKEVLREEGFRVHRYGVPHIAEVSVSYFKGNRWWE